MSLFHLVILALIQGITEFLPISSSGHLILLPGLTGAEDQGLALDVAVHVGTLGAVILYFWADVRVALAGTLRLLRGRIDTRGAFLALCLLVATLPVMLVGLVLHATGLDAALRSVAVIGWAMLGFGLVLYWADRTGPETRAAEAWTLRHAVILGLWQVLALIPGTSRAGITITGARQLGYARHDAARLAMLMSIPTILASGGLLGIEALVAPGAFPWGDAGLAALLAFLAALAALALMMRLLNTLSFTPYVIYRVILGAGLLVYAYS
ncbi:undecaprenyl-diphosphate phosphatase [Roseivivax sp. GX 12232]|uniref:undecaprenyl-diphosphate phosphatase n=1 Tax=Roseivivax sp. GX 12232 TaxID=2900547 RepID=UPI001E415CB7|nr:undecaprenyl-diphosphate phosphatase [Roseivivax sp. GX 12232]MCE0505697.1 undecaprenyl-diphosphate phosphatase [Roseivivax sp. GX 12232]